MRFMNIDSIVIEPTFGALALKTSAEGLEGTKSTRISRIGDIWQDSAPMSNKDGLKRLSTRKGCLALHTSIGGEEKWIEIHDNYIWI